MTLSRSTRPADVSLPPYMLPRVSETLPADGTLPQTRTPGGLLRWNGVCPYCHADGYLVSEPVPNTHVGCNACGEPYAAHASDAWPREAELTPMTPADRRALRTR